MKVTFDESGESCVERRAGIRSESGEKYETEEFVLSFSSVDRDLYFRYRSL